MTLMTISLLAVITFTTRYLFLEGKLPLRLGPNVKQLLSFSAPAVLTAIFVPILFIHEQQLDISPTNQKVCSFQNIILYYRTYLKY